MHSLTVTLLHPYSIGNAAFWDCTKLIILSVPQDTTLGENVIPNTALLKESSLEMRKYVRNYGSYKNTEEVNEWIKNVNEADEFELHRACSGLPLSNNSTLIASSVAYCRRCL